MGRELNDNRFYKNKTTLTVYLVLRGLIIFTLVRAVLRREYQSVFLCALSLVLLIMPSIISRKLKIVLPSTLEIVILLFIFGAEILGELNSFHRLRPGGHDEPQRPLHFPAVAPILSYRLLLLFHDGWGAVGVL